MQILLKATVEKLGESGDIVEVSPGYARNYLIPQNLATIATDESQRQFKAQRQAVVRREESVRKDLEEAAKELEAISCTIVANANPEGHLFGSVGPQAIVDAFEQEGVSLRPSMILLDEPFKEAGVYEVKVQVTPNVVATTRVWIVAG